MATYLFTWNPKSWEWTDLSNASLAVKKGKKNIHDRWSCGNTKKIVKGDRFFLLKQGIFPPTGIFGSGFVKKPPYLDEHWEAERADKGDKALYVRISFDKLLDPEVDGIVERDFLRRDRVFSRVNWDTQRSGIEIVPEIAVELERVWADTTLENDFILPDEIGDEIFEGAQRSVLVNAYERNPRARRKCIEHFGNRCAVCDFDFDKTYGKNVARGYIHVHHLTPLAEIGEEYVVNPI